MPAKKAVRKTESKAGSSPDMGVIWKWVFVVGALVSALAGAFGFRNDILTWILILAGIVVGVLWRSTDDLMGFGIRYLLLLAVATALDALPAIGGYLTGFFQGFVLFLGPVALTTLVMYFLKKYFGLGI
jgi:uncharacterized membrane protein